MTRKHTDLPSEVIEKAATKALELQRATPDAPLDALVAQAAQDVVDVAFQGDSEGASTAPRSAMLEDVSRRIWRLVAGRRGDDQVVDEASEESFPASDAPAWISRSHSDDRES